MNSITLTPAQYKSIINRLETLEIAIGLKKKKKRVTYGSDEWWNESNKQAVRDVESKKYTTIKNKKELQGYLDSLK